MAPQLRWALVGGMEPTAALPPPTPSQTPRLCLRRRLRRTRDENVPPDFERASVARTKAKVVDISVIRTTTLPNSTWVRHPLVRMHFLDRRTGEPLAKPKGEAAQAAVAAVEREMRLEVERKVRAAVGGAAVAPSARDDESSESKSDESSGDGSDAEGEGERGAAAEAAGKRDAKAAKKAATAAKMIAAAKAKADSARTSQSAELWFRPGECTRIAALMTKPASLVDGAAVWNDQLTVNAPLRHFLQPHVVILYELLDYGADLPENITRASGGYLRLAWGFLHPLPSSAARKEAKRAINAKYEAKGASRAARRLAEAERRAKLDGPVEHSSSDDEEDGSGAESEAGEEETKADAGEAAADDEGAPAAAPAEGEDETKAREAKQATRKERKGASARKHRLRRRATRKARAEKTNLGLKLRVQLWKWPPAFERERWSALHSHGDKLGLDLHLVPDVFLAYQQKKRQRERYVGCPQSLSRAPLWSVCCLHTFAVDAPLTQRRRSLCAPLRAAVPPCPLHLTRAGTSLH